MAIAVLTPSAHVDDVLAILVPIAQPNAVIVVDDAHRRARSSSHQFTRLVTLVRLMFTPSFDTPSKDEHAMVHAHVAGLRSSDLGRQVGAALTSPDGEVIATGTNDVPCAGGGIYWEGAADDARDFQLRHNVSKER